MSFSFSFNISGAVRSTKIDTSSIFNAAYVEPDKPPIELFEEDLRKGIRALGAPPTPITPEWDYIASLLVLGAVSSVETYMRRIIRRVLILDPLSQEVSFSKVLPFGAAINHQSDMLPEALLEESTFCSSKGISNSVSSFLGIQLPPKRFATALDEYEVVCQLRHCIIHRSGKLGAKNAISMGLDQHKRFLEKPVTFDFDLVQKTFAICETLVREVNNYLFSQILFRAAKNVNWKNDLRSDKKFIKAYFDLFAISSENTNKNIRTCHSELMPKFYVP